jgi:hypothetical protein
MAMNGFRADANAIFTASVSFMSMKDYLAEVEAGIGMAPGPSECEPSDVYASLPQVEQHHNWAVNHLIAPFWPEGDPGTLQAAAATWEQAANLLGEVIEVMAKATHTMVSDCAGVAFDSFYAYADQFVGLNGQRDALLSATETTCRNLSACSGPSSP